MKIERTVTLLACCRKCSDNCGHDTNRPSAKRTCHRRYLPCRPPPPARFKSARHLQRFASVHDQVANLFMHCRYNTNAQEKRQARKQAFEAWETVTGNPMLDRLAALFRNTYLMI